MKQTIFKFSFLMLVLFSIVGFGYFHKFIRKNSVIEKQNSETLIIDSKVLDKKACLDYFGKDIIKAGFIPVSITIENATDRYFKFSPTDITLKTIPAEVVAKKAHNKTFLRTFFWKIGSFFNPFLSLPGSAHSALEENANDKLDRKVILQTAYDRLIAPQAIIENVIFVEKYDFQNEFTLLLADKKSNDNIVCKINLENSPTIYQV